nr:MAG TPA: hypothetical protein [Caudoviricetes sp.]
MVCDNIKIVWKCSEAFRGRADKSPRPLLK